MAPAGLSPRVVVNEHPAGSETVCFVNPVAPSEAMINRRMNAGPIFGMGALVFMFLTGGPFFPMLREPRRKKKLMGPVDPMSFDLSSGSPLQRAESNSESQ
jgi:hypothetical protein